MISGTIKEHQAVGPPAGSISVQLQAQVSEEHTEDLLVGSGLGQAQVDGASGVDGGQHGDPRRHRQGRYRVALSWGLPLIAPEVTDVDPGLINADHSGA